MDEMNILVSVEFRSLLSRSRSWVLQETKRTTKTKKNRKSFLRSHNRPLWQLLHRCWERTLGGPWPSIKMKMFFYRQGRTQRWETTRYLFSAPWSSMAVVLHPGARTPQHSVSHLRWTAPSPAKLSIKEALGGVSPSLHVYSQVSGPHTALFQINQHYLMGGLLNNECDFEFVM